MNPHQKPQEDVVVTQEDREAASDMLSESWSYEAATGHVRSGQWDDHPLVQAFARHRLLGHEAGRRDMREEAGKVADEYAAGCQKVLRDDEFIGESLAYARGCLTGSQSVSIRIRNIPTEPLGGEG